MSNSKPEKILNDLQILQAKIDFLTFFNESFGDRTLIEEELQTASKEAWLAVKGKFEKNNSGKLLFILSKPGETKINPELNKEIEIELQRLKKKLADFRKNTYPKIKDEMLSELVRKIVSEGIKLEIVKNKFGKASILGQVKNKDKATKIATHLNDILQLFGECKVRRDDRSPSHKIEIKGFDEKLLHDLMDKLSLKQKSLVPVIAKKIFEKGIQLKIEKNHAGAISFSGIRKKKDADQISEQLNAILESFNATCTVKSSFFSSYSKIEITGLSTAAAKELSEVSEETQLTPGTPGLEKSKSEDEKEDEIFDVAPEDSYHLIIGTVPESPSTTNKILESVDPGLDKKQNTATSIQTSSVPRSSAQKASIPRPSPSTQASFAPRSSAPGAFIPRPSAQASSTPRSSSPASSILKSSDQLNHTGSGRRLFSEIASEFKKLDALKSNTPMRTQKKIAVSKPLLIKRKIEQVESHVEYNKHIIKFLQQILNTVDEQRNYWHKIDKKPDTFFSPELRGTIDKIRTIITKIGSFAERGLVDCNSRMINYNKQINTTFPIVSKSVLENFKELHVEIQAIKTSDLKKLILNSDKLEKNLRTDLQYCLDWFGTFDQIWLKLEHLAVVEKSYSQSSLWNLKSNVVSPIDKKEKPEDISKHVGNNQEIGLS